MTQTARLRLQYVAADYVSTLAALLLFVVARFHFETVAHSMGSISAILSTSMVKLELLLYPPLMLFIYWLSGFYNDVITKSRTQMLLQTLWSTVIGIITFFLIAMIDDLEPEKITTYKLLLILAGILTGCTYLTRLAVTARIKRKVKEGAIRRYTLITGTGEQSHDLAERLEKASVAMGLRIAGFIDADGDARGERGQSDCASDSLPVFTADEAMEMIGEGRIQCVAVAEASGDDLSRTVSVINRYLPLGCSVLVSPAFYQSMAAPVRTFNILGEPMMDVANPCISPGTINIKRTIDVVISAIGLLVLWPAMLVIGLMVRHDSPGPAIYSQRRIGKNKKPFTIYKFRSMHTDAEVTGPMLSSENDPRITRLGRKLRKYRLDELPQLWNILRGDMSLVGPRPEREYFIERILEKAPSYSLVQQVRPGLTSWGMVKFGYASSVDQMVDRLRYELIYLDNMSVILDLRIIIYTVKVVLTGRGI